MGALNIAYHVKNDRRPWWKQRLIQLGMVVVAGGLLAIAAAVMMAGPNIVGAVARVTNLGGLTTWGWMILQYPLAFAFLVVAFWLMYYILPDFPQHKKQIVVGATIAAALWVIATTLFRLYVIHFTTFNKAYGTIGGVLLLLTWMYYSMLVVLAGGELNAELAKGTAEVAPQPKTEYDKQVAAAQSERAAQDRHEERKKDEKELDSASKREELAKK
jgi:membrane protein